jgi:hypothetical protein
VAFRVQEASLQGAEDVLSEVLHTAVRELVDSGASCGPVGPADGSPCGFRLVADSRLISVVAKRPSVAAHGSVASIGMWESRLGRVRQLYYRIRLGTSVAGQSPGMISIADAVASALDSCSRVLEQRWMTYAEWLEGGDRV